MWTRMYLVFTMFTEVTHLYGALSYSCITEMQFPYKPTMGGHPND